MMPFVFALLLQTCLSASAAPPYAGSNSFSASLGVLNQERNVTALLNRTRPSLSR